MNPSKKRFGGTKLLVGAASLVVLIAGLKAAQIILVPFLFAVFLAILGTGPVVWLQNKRVPNLVSVLSVSFLIITVFVGIGFFLGNSLNEFTLTMPQYKVRFSELTVSLVEWFNDYGLNLQASDIFDSLEPSAFMELLTSTLSRFVGAFTSIILVIIMMIFMLFEAADFRKKLRTALDTSVDMERFTGVAFDVQRYMAVKTVTSGITGVVVGTWVWFMGVEFPILWGILAFFLNFVPFIGSIIASIPAVMLSIIQLELGGAITLAVGYVVINIGVSNFLEPVLMGPRLGLSPLIVFLALVVWGWIWGPAGMLLAVPLTMIVKILLEHSEDFRWIATLMDSKPREVR